jgi:hypothetical protein
MAEHFPEDPALSDPQIGFIHEILETLGMGEDEPRPSPLEAALTAYFAEEAQDPPDSPLYYVGPDGTTRPRDPVTGTILRFGDIPPSLLEEEQMRYGFDFWRTHGHEVRLSLLLTMHTGDGDIAGSGIDLPAVVQRLKEEDGMLFLEGVADAEVTHNMERFYALLANLPAKEREGVELLIAGLLGEAPQLTTEADVTRAIAATGVRPTYVDVIGDGTGIADRTAMMLKQAAAAIEESEEQDPVELLRVRQSEDYYRDMYIIGKMGAMLADEFNATDRIPDAALLVGILHKAVGKILGAMGAQVTIVGGLNERRGLNMLADLRTKGELSTQDIIALAEEMYAE